LKTGLVTFYHIHHYGAFLQACATQRAVEGLGSECEILNYYVNQNNALFKRPTGLLSAASDAHTALHYGPLKTRYERFEAFARANLHITSHRWESIGELRRSCPPCDVYLAGSDQIWNPRIFPDGKFDPVFFCGFTQGRKIAYAPSFGIPHIPDSMEGELREYLGGFSHLSVREKQGQKIVREVSGREVPVVLDPTLLLRREEWSGLAAAPAPSLERGYILAYCISAPGALSPYIAQLAAETGLPVVQLCGIRQKVHKSAHCILDAGPAEFLGLFRDASYVCTNSFHGTVFSVLFEKPFFTSVAPSEMAAPEQSRTYSLLSTLGLTERIIGKGDTAQLKDGIDWLKVEQSLTTERERSLDYLRDALLDCRSDKEEPAAPEESGMPRLASRSACTGCTACRSGCPKNAITMVRDREGFLYPHIDPDACVRCGHCTAVCPVLREREPGPLPAVYAAWNKDDTIRKDSTSGGIFSLLAEDTLESGGVVFGAALDARQHLRHIACFKKEELRHLRGAKYVQSDLGDTYREVRELLKSRPVLFSGTPCQVDGLYQFLGSRPENLTTCDLVCHGVPSPGVWEDYVNDLQARKKPLQTVRFRNKVAGWKDSHFTLLYRDGTVDTAPLFATEYGRAFGRALFLRPSCYRCPYTSMTRVGDFTLGDFWGLRPDELPDQQEAGVSLLLVNTPHASHVFDRLPLGRKAFPAERAIAGNPRLASPIAAPADRAAFFAAYALRPFCEVRREFFRLPSLPVRLASRALSPEMKAKLRKKMK